jgi:hypothetical protein
MNDSYPVVRSQPVAKFYYQGSHSHPVRRTVLVVENNKNLLTGYELREGSVTRNFDQAPIKSYRHSKIARIEQCGRRLRKRTPKDNHQNTTYVRRSLLDLVKEGV